MREPSPKLQAALGELRPKWDAVRTERTLQGLDVRRRRRRLGAALSGSAALAALCAIGFVALSSDPAQQLAGAAQAPPAVGTSSAPAVAGTDTESQARQELKLQDGSSVTMLDADTRVALEQSDRQRVALRLRAGKARFSVVPRGHRVFQVRTDHVSVEVLGTVFEVEQGSEQTRVAVTRGRVAVVWGSERRELGAGDDGWFPPLPRAGNDADATDAPAPKRESRSWRDHAERGDFKRAYALLKGAGDRVSPDVAELMLAADAARLSGHPRAAVPYLRRVIAEYPKDARAPLAAFTLGGVLMNQLGLPREAEAAYALARKGTQSAALSQDALARQVEAAHRAGDDALSRRLAQQYAREYPRGRRLHAVRGFGGLR